MSMPEHLYVDCDDTLVLWSWGGATAPHLPAENRRCADFVRRWLAANPGRRVTVWSLGGEEWAAAVAARVLPGVEVETAERWPKLPAPGELFIDDDPFPTYANETIHPKHLCHEPDFFHGGAPGLIPGGWVLPPSETGAKSLLDWNIEARARGIDMKVLPARRDRVYVTKDMQSAAVFAIAHPEAGDLYYVAPVGPLSPDPDCLVPGESFEARRALVLAVLPISAGQRRQGLREFANAKAWSEA